MAISDCVESVIRGVAPVAEQDDTVMENIPAVEDAAATVVDAIPAVANTVPTDIPVDFTVAEDCAYVMFKDKKIVTFYSNNFDGLEVTEQVMDPDVHPDLSDKIGGFGVIISLDGS